MLVGQWNMIANWIGDRGFQYYLLAGSLGSLMTEMYNFAPWIVRQLSIGFCNTTELGQIAHFAGRLSQRSLLSLLSGVQDISMEKMKLTVKLAKTTIEIDAIFAAVGLFKVSSNYDHSHIYYFNRLISILSLKYSEKPIQSPFRTGDRTIWHAPGNSILVVTLLLNNYALLKITWQIVGRKLYVLTNNPLSVVWLSPPWKRPIRETRIPSPPEVSKRAALFCNWAS